MNSIKNNILAVPLFYNLLQILGGGKKAFALALREIIDYDKCSSIIDFGCGTANIIDDLPSSIDYWGCDGNVRYVNYAQNKWRERGTFFVAEFNDTGTFVAPPNIPAFDYALALGVLHHLEDKQAVSLLKSSAKLLKQSGSFISIDLVTINNQNRLAKFFNRHDRGKFVRYSAEYVALAKLAFVNIDFVVHSDLMWLPHDLLVMECKGILE